jgi:hypothetical protein
VKIPFKINSYPYLVKTQCNKLQNIFVTANGNQGVNDDVKEVI